MNRIEFMTELAALLQDISVEERTEAMKYYNDYFDDAGVENEQSIIEELGNPAKVAAEVKAGLKGQDNTSGEFTETGYTDSRFEDKEAPARREHTGGAGSAGRQAQPEPRTSNVLKIVLIVLIVLFGLPVLLPIGIGLACAVFGIVIAIFSLFFALVIASIAIVIAGVTLFCVGIASLVPAFAVGLALSGAGMIVSVIGIIASVASVRLCTIVFPGICRGIVWICRRPFQRKAVA